MNEQRNLPFVISPYLYLKFNCVDRNGSKLWKISKLLNEAKPFGRRVWWIRGK